MRKMYLVSLSVAAAALIVATGCSSSDDGGDAGLSAPAELTQGVELNTSVVTNAMALFGGTMDSLPDLAPARFAAMRIARSSSTENESSTQSCDINGTRTITTVYKETGDKSAKPNENWSEEFTEIETYDNCIDNYSGVNFVGDALDERLTKGSSTYIEYDSYSSDTNQSTSRFSGKVNVSEIKRSSTTKATITSNTNDNFSSEATFDGLDDEATNANFKDSFSYYGTSEMYHTNANGDRVAGVGERIDLDFKETSERIYTVAKSTSLLDFDGFIAVYETNSTGEHMVYGYYANNYHVARTKEGDEETTSISGKIGGSCLGGSVTVTVDPIIKENDVDYIELPYAGYVTLQGSNKATIEFSVADDTLTPQTTQAGVTVDGNPQVQFTTWNALAAGECDDR